MWVIQYVNYLSVLKYDMELKDFGNRIAQIRQSKNISAYELSLQINRDASYISQVESGKVNISIKTMFDICRALEINAKELF